MAATTRLVNGVEVPLTPEEQAAIEAEWAANQPPPPRRKRKLTDIRRDVDNLPKPQLDDLLRDVLAKLIHQGVAAASILNDEPDPDPRRKP